MPGLDSTQAQCVESLRREGTVVLDKYLGAETVLRLREQFDDALRALDFEMPCLAQTRLDPVRHRELIEDYLYASPAQLESVGAAFSRSEATSLDQVVSGFEPSTLTSYMLARSPLYRSVWLDPYILAIVAHYMGLVPKLAEAYVRRNFPARFRVMNHYWHRDLNDHHQLVKVFIFLSDTSVDNGPHEFIRGSHIDLAVLNGQRYYSDAEIDVAYPPVSPRRLVSEVPAGTVIIEDTRGLHRAQNPHTGYRDLGYAVFVPLPDNTRLHCYDFPAADADDLTAFQRAFIPRGVLC
ncbi:MAG: phytanoyl-CoA dioxygenase [Betaproteobacteria bacterium]|nr:phytanoyl-CoA dioxygenase [Betaproteobacteria bacterium]